MELMFAIAVCCCALLGYGQQALKRWGFLVVVLPLTISIAFLLIADIDSPRGGFIRVGPENVVDLSASLRP